ncbi:acyl-CoA dehydrogenase family protein [Jatrophihabitans sp. DSM 45814]
MAWDFQTEPEFQEKLDWVEEFCREEIDPLDLLFPGAAKSRDPKMKALVAPLKQRVKQEGLWALFLDEELGGPGYGQLKLALLNEVLGAHGSAPVIFGTQGPDTGNMEILAAYGTPEQKARWLYPLMEQELWSAFSMTEPQGGSDPSLFRTAAVRDGDHWLINGEKWFTSFGKAADILLVMCQNGIFVVEQGTPGVEWLSGAGDHDHARYNNVRVPLDHLLGPEGGGRTLAQHRLGGGRIHHAMRTVSACRKAFDMMCERALSRTSHGKTISDHQMVQEAIADSYAELNMLRLLVLWTAWTIDNSSTRAARTQIAACKYTCAKIQRDIVFRAIHVFGSLGVTHLTPLQDMWASVPTQFIMDGPNEVHQVTVARNVLKGYEPHEGDWPTQFIPHQREAAKKKYAAVLAADPELAELVERLGREAYETIS